MRWTPSGGVAGIGTAGLTGNILATVAGPRCPVPIIGHRSAGVPGWVGAADVWKKQIRKERKGKKL